MTGLAALDSLDSVATLGSARRLGPLAHFAVHLVWAFLLGGPGCNSIQTTLRLLWDGAYAPIFSLLWLISMGWWMEWDRRQNKIPRFLRFLNSTMPFTFVLGKSALLFIPPSPDKPRPYPTCDGPLPYPLPSVVQVIVKAAQEYPEETRAFGVVKEEVTKAIITFLAATRDENGIPEELVMEGKGYLLHGSRKGWALAPRLELFWGEVPIQCSPWKWRFIFQLLQ